MFTCDELAQPKRPNRSKRKGEFDFFTYEEDLAIIEHVREFGFTWTECARKLPKRTSHAVRNRYKRLQPNLRVSKQYHCSLCGQLKRGHTCVGRTYALIDGFAAFSPTVVAPPHPPSSVAPSATEQSSAPSSRHPLSVPCALKWRPVNELRAPIATRNVALPVREMREPPGEVAVSSTPEARAAPPAEWHELLEHLVAHF